MAWYEILNARVPRDTKRAALQSINAIATSLMDLANDPKNRQTLEYLRDAIADYENANSSYPEIRSIARSFAEAVIEQAFGSIYATTLILHQPVSITLETIPQRYQTGGKRRTRRRQSKMRKTRRSALNTAH